MECPINEPISHSIRSSVRKILRPLIRFLLRQQISYPIVCQWMKEMYVEIADKEFPLDDKPQSDSRITLLTGIHRKEVRRLRHPPPPSDKVPESVSLGPLLVATWLGTPRYQDKDGNPAPLPRFSTEVEGPSFEELVVSANKDIRPRVILDEWVRLGICQLDEDENVHLNEESFIPEKGFEEKLFFLGKNVHDHLAASVHNMQQPENPFLERSVYYDELTMPDIETLSHLTRDLGNQVLRKTNQKAMQLQQASKTADDANYRMNFGIYFFAEHEAEPTKSNSEKDL